MKLLNLLGLLASVAWLARHPDWEPAVTSIGLFASLIALEVSDKKKNSKELLNETDRKLFEQFCKEFPSDGKSARFLSEHDLGVSWHDQQLYEIDNFLRKWTTAEYEFQNEKLEEYRKDFYRLLNDFRCELALHSFPTHREDRYSLGLEDLELRQEMLDLRDRLNEMGTFAYQAHQDLVKMGRKLLG